MTALTAATRIPLAAGGSTTVGDLVTHFGAQGAPVWVLSVDRRTGLDVYGLCTGVFPKDPGPTMALAVGTNVANVSMEGRVLVPNGNNPGTSSVEAQDLNVFDSVLWNPSNVSGNVVPVAYGPEADFTGDAIAAAATAIAILDATPGRTSAQLLALTPAEYNWEAFALDPNRPPTSPTPYTYLCKYMEWADAVAYWFGAPMVLRKGLTAEQLPGIVAALEYETYRGLVYGQYTMLTTAAQEATEDLWALRVQSFHTVAVGDGLYVEASE